MEVTTIPVHGEGDLGHVRREVERVAKVAGFDAEAIAELAIVATELATNLVRHRAIDGKILVSSVTSGQGGGIKIVSRDRGPGIADVELALKDHHSTKGTSGCGLGAVRRLMDEFSIQSSLADSNGHGAEDQSQESGTVITTRKWVQSTSQQARFIYSAHSRPIPGVKANGDSFFVAEDRQGLLVAVVDGLGHGHEAARVSEAAAEHIRLNKTRSPGALVRELHDLLRGTRGAAATLVRIQMPERRLFHAAIGNVEARLYPHRSKRLVPRPGVLGMGPPPRPRVNEVPWPANATLVVFSDGLVPEWDMGDSSDLISEKVRFIGHNLMRDYARTNDDATVVVAREIV